MGLILCRVHRPQNPDLQNDTWAAKKAKNNQDKNIKKTHNKKKN